MKICALAATILAEPAEIEALVVPLDDTAAAELVEHFKSEADRHWFINANRSLEFAELIIRIGRQRGDLRHTALGTMARGDALKFLGNLQEAWDELESAGNMFTDMGDEVGWARTRIGKLALCVDMQRVADTLADAEKARQILTYKNVQEKLLILDLNVGHVYNLVGEQHRALASYQVSLEASRLLGEPGERWQAPIYTNIGNVYYALGKLTTALRYHKLALKISESHREPDNIVVSILNMAYITMNQGDYKKSLAMLEQAHQISIKEHLSVDEVYIKHDLVDCYLHLNRYSEARELAGEVLMEYSLIGATYQKGLILLHIAIAEAELGSFPQSLAALAMAEEIFLAIGSKIWALVVFSYRGRVLFKQGNFEEAYQLINNTIAKFDILEHNIHYTAAMLLRGQSSSAKGNNELAQKDAKYVLSVSKQCNLPSLRYNAYLLLGHIAAYHGQPARARRYYTAAFAIVERLQRRMTITLRPGFLEDKGEAIRALLGLYLHEANIVRALETLERAKSQTLLGYLSNRNELYWSREDPYSRTLLEELKWLREEHHWFYQVANEQLREDDALRSAISPEQACAEVVIREKRMRAITEQLYLQGGDSVVQVKPPKLRDVQAEIGDDELLIEYYNDGVAFYVFIVDRHTLAVERLDTTVNEVDTLLAQLQSNISFALGVDSRSQMLPRLNGLVKRILGRLHAALLTPFIHRLRSRRRLIIVPYGALHYLPFHLLHDGADYLIERHELVVLPAASLLTRRGPARPAGVRVLVHSWGGRLPHTQAEAQLVKNTFDSSVYSEEAARRDALASAPTQILHIAAHGEHRLDQPDLSFIHLADGQLYTDDLLQLDMSYELVVLSACETGRAKVAAGDELIGLGRGFLYAGAGALVASLWRVTDDTTVTLMGHFYANLRAGLSKAAALRNAQLALFAEQPNLHPAFWGAFQLVGDARPLTGFSDGAPSSSALHPLIFADLKQ